MEWSWGMSLAHTDPTDLTEFDLMMLNLTEVDGMVVGHILGSHRSHRSL